MTPKQINGNSWNLMDMSVAGARKFKWKAGAEEHGQEMTLDPLEELFSEQLDSINYARALSVDTSLPPDVRTELLGMSQLFITIAERLQKIRRELPDRVYQPQAFPFV